MLFNTVVKNTFYIIKDLDRDFGSIKMIKCKYYVYLLKSTVSNRTYVGYTVNIKRRLRQHNGEIKG